MGTSLYDLSGRVAIITGGDTGIGRAIALEFAGAGANLTLAGPNLDHLKPAARQITDMGRKCLSVSADVRRPKPVENMVKKTLEEFGRVDFLINNAGANFRSTPEKIRQKEWNEVLGINLTGTFLCSRAVFPVMARQKAGVIINISSIAGRDGSPSMAHYGAAEAGVMNLTLSLASAWAKHGIRVNCIVSGHVQPEGEQEALEDREAEALKQVGLGRWGKPEEVARAVLYMASKAADFVTGALLNVDGGPKGRIS